MAARAQFLVEVTWSPKEITVPPQALHSTLTTLQTFGRYSDVRKEIVTECSTDCVYN